MGEGKKILTMQGKVDSKVQIFEKLREHSSKIYDYSSRTVGKYHKNVDCEESTKYKQITRDDLSKKM